MIRMVSGQAIDAMNSAGDMAPIVYCNPDMRQGRFRLL
jgi:hypothetical protein